MEIKSCPIRILHVFSKLNRGGAETMIMNIYRNINRNEIQFDFLCLSSGEFDYVEEIKNLGGRIYILDTDFAKNPLINTFRIIKIIKKFGPFIAIHAHSLPSFILTLARFMGIRKRISHVHSTYTEKKISFIRKFYMWISRKMLCINATDLVACSNDAGRYFYGERFDINKKGLVIQNAIDITKYKDSNKNYIKELKKEFGISEKMLIIGHIGSYRPVKNHDFLIRLANYIKQRNIKFKMILVGNGSLFNEIKNKVSLFDLDNNVLLLGMRTDIPELLNLFDVLLMPSFFEGIPVTVVEAQAACTPCIISDTITREVDMECGLVDYINLNDDYEIWLNKIIQAKDKNANLDFVFRNIYDKGYDVENSIDLFYKLYRLKDEFRSC